MLPSRARSRSPSGGTMWGVCIEGYDIVRKEGEDLLRPLRPFNYWNFDPYDKDGWVAYRPLEETPDLFLRFARLYEDGCSVSAILGWSHKYGLLGSDYLEGAWDEGMQHSTLSGFKNEVVRAAAILAMYEAALDGNGEQAKQLILERFPMLAVRYRERDELYDDEDERREAFFHSLTREARDEEVEGIAEEVEESFGGDYHEYALEVAAWMVEDVVRRFCYQALRVEPGTHDPSRLVAGWRFTNLLGAMYLQMYWLMASGGRAVTRCEYCRRIISLAPPLPGTRKPRGDKRFCDSNCRQKNHQRKRSTAR